jgi:Mn-dependent DtxR family transcriptional regulator
MEYARSIRLVARVLWSLADPVTGKVEVDEHEVSAELGIERDTLQRALRRLHHDGLISYQALPPGMGSRRLRDAGELVRHVVVSPLLEEVGQ